MILAIALVLSMSTWFSASAVIPQLRIEWQLTDATAAWLTIAVQLGFVAGAVFSSVLNLSDVVPVRTIMIVSSLGAAGANLLLLLADGPLLALPLRFLTGAFLAGLYPPALKLMATWFKTGRGTALGVMVGALTLGSALPHLVNALGGLDWPTVIVATSLATAIGALIVWTLVREGPFPFPQAVFDMRQVASYSATARSCWRPWVTSATCGSSTRCGHGSSFSSALRSSPVEPRTERSRLLRLSA